MAWDTCISMLDTQPPEERGSTIKGAKSPSLAAEGFHDPWQPGWGGSDIILRFESADFTDVRRFSGYIREIRIFVPWCPGG